MKQIKKVYDPRWFIWTLAIVVASSIGFFGYIQYTIEQDGSLTTDTFLQHRFGTDQNHSQELPDHVTPPGWRKYELPNSLVAFDYPQEWTLKKITTNETVYRIGLSKKEYYIEIYTYADQGLTNPSTQSPDESAVRNTYIGSLGGNLSPQIADPHRDSYTVRVSEGKNKGLHTIFFVGTLLIDVWSSSANIPEYKKIAESFRYSGF